MDPSTVVLQLAVVTTIAASLGIVWWLARPNGRWGRTLRERFVLGVPWGTLVSIALVLCVYLFVQDGITNWYRPLRLPFSSWSYLYPLGWATAPFAHANAGHLIGNLTTTVVLAPLAEYIWGHYPRDRGEQTFSSWRANPWIRAFVLFPLGVIVVGLFTSLFAWGPVIGFSGVVFAFAGFTLVRYPLITVVALSVRSAARVIYNALSNPVVVESASTSFSYPSWYGIAVQGHALGLFLGLIAGALLLYRRGERPDPLRLWIGAFLVGTSMSLWAIWWYRGPGTFVLYRGLGVMLVSVLALLVTVSLVSSDRSLWGDLTRRQAAVLVLIAPLVTMGLVAIPLNLTTVEGAELPDAAVSVGDYTVFYDEGVENRMVSIVEAEVFGETTQVNTSGVIVISESRQIWTTHVSKNRLEANGRATVDLGGVGWRDSVRVERAGWEPVGNESVYQVWLRHDGQWTHAFASESRQASPVIDGREVHLAAEDGKFAIEVRENETADRVFLPEVNETVSAGGIEFTREADEIVAEYGETRVVVAERETYV